MPIVTSRWLDREIEYEGDDEGEGAYLGLQLDLIAQMINGGLPTRAFHVSHEPSEIRDVEELLGAHFQRKRDWGILKGEDVTNTTALDNAREAAIIGNPEECIRKIEAYREQYAPDELILLMGFQGIGAESLERSIRTAGEEIIPHFRA